MDSKTNLTNPFFYAIITINKKGGILMDRLHFYERCGAKQFQKIVLVVEKIKYRLLKPFSKLAIHMNDKAIDRKIKKALKKQKRTTRKNVPEETKQMISYYQKEKMRFRREIAKEKNRNYHLDMNNINQTLSYLQMNKQIHQNGIILNIIKSVIALILMNLFTIIPNSIIIIYFIIQGVSAIINFECINLQNYNMLRINLKKEQLSRIQLQKNKKSIQRYGEISNAISPLLEQEKLPSKEDIASSITTLEQLQQMRKMITAITEQKEKIYVKKGE